MGQALLPAQFYLCVDHLQSAARRHLRGLGLRRPLVNHRPHTLLDDLQLRLVKLDASRVWGRSFGRY
jgi:hypothetical protein